MNQRAFILKANVSVQPALTRDILEFALSNVKSYLAEFLLEKGYIVHDLKRRASAFKTRQV